MSALINNGGEVFPCERDYGLKLESSGGMSLRDYFAHADAMLKASEQ